MPPHHSLRDTNLTALAKAGLPAFSLQAHAGHASITTTQGYVNREEVAAAGYAAQLEQALFGTRGTNAGYNIGSEVPDAGPANNAKSA